MLQLNDGRMLYQSPEDDCQTAFLNWVAGAHHSLYIADYALNIPVLIIELVGLANKSVTVGLVLDASMAVQTWEAPEIKQLRANSKIKLVIGTSIYHKIMHNKFAIRDGTQSQYGSWNYTTAASKEDNMFFIDPTLEVCTALKDKWQKMYTYMGGK